MIYLNVNNLNTFGLVINHGNTVSNGDIFISSDKNPDNYTYLKNNGTILSKKLLINSDESDSRSNINVKSISLNRVIESLKQYNDSIIYVNDIINYILNHVDEIKIKGFNEVLKPYVENNYYEDFDYYCVGTLNKENYLFDEIGNNINLSTSKKYSKYIGIPVSNIIELNDSGKYIYFPNEGNQIIKGSNIPNSHAYEIFQKKKMQLNCHQLKEVNNPIITTSIT